MFCTELPAEERCDGCPLPDNLQPHELLAMSTSVADILNQQTDSSDHESFVTGLTKMQDELEPAVRHLAWGAGLVATWRMVGACEQYDGPILYDPEKEHALQARLNVHLNALKGE